MSDKTQTLPRWNVTDVHESFESRSFVDALEQVGADTTRLTALFDEHDIRRCKQRPVTAADGVAADAVIRAVNETDLRSNVVAAHVYATVTTDSFNEKAQGLASELDVIDSQQQPLVARLAEWVSSLGVDALAAVSTEVAEHRGPLAILAVRAEHQMAEAEEGLYAELTTTASTAWERLHSDVTSQLTEVVEVPGGAQTLPMAADRLALLDVNLVGALQTVVDIRSRLSFETEVFARRQRRTIGVSEFNEMMLSAQADAYGDGLDQSTAHPHMWVVKPHYYSAQFYNWPYTYGLLFGLGLFAKYREDPERFRQSYDDVLSRAGMNTAEELGAAFGFDVCDESFWTASVDVLRDHIDQYMALAADVLASPESASDA